MNEELRAVLLPLLVALKTAVEALERVLNQLPIPEEPPPEEEEPEPEQPPEEEEPSEPPSGYAPQFTWAVQEDGLTVKFSARNPALPERGTVTTWAFGDGTTDDRGGKFPTHKYDRPGTYPVVMHQVNAGAGIDGRLTQNVTVAGEGSESPPPPTTEEPPPPPPPPPPPDSDEVPDLPVRVVRNYDGIVDSAWDPSKTVMSGGKVDRARTLRANGWDDHETLPIVNDPVDGKPAIMYRFPAGSKTGQGVGISQMLESQPLHLTHALLEIDVLLWKWQGNGSGTNKGFFLGQGDGGSNQLYVDFHGSGDNDLHLTFALQGVTHKELGYAPRPPGSSGRAGDLLVGPKKLFTVYPPLVPSVLNVEWKTERRAVVERDRWHRVGIEIIHNTPGRPDGEVRLYLDGFRVARVWNLDLTRNGKAFTNIYHGRPILGGGGASNTRDMALYYRNLVLSGT